MSARSRMIRRAVLQRDAATGTDVYGQPNTASWQTAGTLPCWVYSRVAQEITDTQGVVVIEDVHALFSTAADVRHGDRVSSFTDRLGNVLWVGPFEVDTVVRRSDHQEAVLRRVS